MRSVDVDVDLNQRPKRETDCAGEMLAVRRGTLRRELNRPWCPAPIEPCRDGVKVSVVGGDSLEQDIDLRLSNTCGATP